MDLSHKFGGASSRALELLRALPAGQAGLAAIPGSPVAQAALKLGLNLHPIGSSKSDWRVLPHLMRVIRHEDYQVLDTQNVQSKFWGSLAALLTGTILVSTLNSWYQIEHGNNWKGRLYTALELGTNFRTSRHIVVSRSIHQALLNAGIAAHSIDLIYNAVKIVPQVHQQEAGWLKASLGLPADAVVGVSVGRLVWAKGYEDLVAALAELNGRLPRLHVVIIGDGELKEALDQLIAEKKLGHCIHLLGFREHDTALEILNASDFFVMPSRQEGTPIALLEAAALGKPILSTGCGGIPELVTDQEHALLVPAGDVHALAEGLVRFHDNPDFAARLGRNAQERVTRDFSLDTQVQLTLETYRKAVNSP